MSYLMEQQTVILTILCPPTKSGCPKHLFILGKKRFPENISIFFWCLVWLKKRKMKLKQKHFSTISLFPHPSTDLLGKERCEDFL